MSIDGATLNAQKITLTLFCSVVRFFCKTMEVKYIDFNYTFT